MPKITENITSLKETISLLDLIEDEEYQQQNGFTADDVPAFREELLGKIEEYKSEIHSYVEFKLREINNSNILITGITAEIERLKKLQAGYERTVEKGKGWISYLLQSAKIDKLNTEFNQLSFRSSSSVEITDEALLPPEYIKVKETKSPDKTAIKEAIKSGETVPGATVIEKQNLQIK